MIDFGKDNMGRDSLEVGNNSFCSQKIIPFKNWVTLRYGDVRKFDALSIKDKEKIFLRWKWGFNDERANEEVEMNEKHILFLNKDNDLSGYKEGIKFHIQQKRHFDRICYETKKEIGLAVENRIAVHPEKQTPEVEIIKDIFQAENIY